VCTVLARYGSRRFVGCWYSFPVDVIPLAGVGCWLHFCFSCYSPIVLVLLYAVPWFVPRPGAVYAVVAAFLFPLAAVSMSIFFLFQDPCCLRCLDVGRHFDSIRVLHVAVD
jgi:hypothetical protein